MKETSRRNLLKVTAIGGVTAALGLAVRPERGSIAAAEKKEHPHKKVSGPLASATMTFGSWQTGPTPFDRLTVPNPPMGARNHHPITPDEVTIQSEGTVNFIISGFHNIQIYDHGTKPDDINITLLLNAPPGGPPFPPLIDDPNKRIYRGIDPRANPTNQDRVEAVNFSRPGVYLVICGVLPHFVNDDMYGFIRVVS